MRIHVAPGHPTRLAADGAVITVWQEDLKRGAIAADDLRRLDRETRGALSAAIKARRFAAKDKQQFEASGAGGRPVIFLGGGRRAKIDARGWLCLGARAAHAAQRRRCKTLALAPRADVAGDTARLIAEGAHLGAYRYEECRGKGTKAGAKPAAVRTVTLCVPKAFAADLAKHAKTGAVVGEALDFARDLVNAPGNVLTAGALAARTVAWGEASGVAVRVIEKKQLERMGCGGILAVNRGSAEPPRMIVMRHRPRPTKTDHHLALVGKGVTFDSGGISLKPGGGMHRMKTDMAGAAAVIAAMGVIARLELPIKVTAVVPATDNMPDADATKPGDVITHLNSKTVEVLNTDAEGRMILADALAYVCQEAKPTHLVDLATLTGSCVVALGQRIAGVMGNSDEFRTMLCDVAATAGEQVWPLPLNADFTAQLKSEVADLANIGGGRWGGALTGGAFLQEFVTGAQWCHLDIAGPNEAEKPYAPFLRPGGTGFGVQTAVRLAEALSV